MKLFKWLKKRIQLFQLSKRINSSEVEIVNIYQADTTNVGDLMCAPFLYFPELQRKSITVSIMNFCNDINFKNKIIILGGGGLFQKYFQVPVERIFELGTRNSLIVWGAGMDNYVDDSPLLPDLSKCSIVGLRDYGINNIRYVPCASCMSSLFDQYRLRESKYQVKLYLHVDYSFEIVRQIGRDVPTMKNTDSQNLETILKFLSDGEVILTNSFHGAYWSTLLNKKVIVLPWIDPRSGSVGYSKKFLTLKYPPVFLDNWNDYRSLIQKAKRYPTALAECREENRRFYQDVLHSVFRK